MSLFRKKLYNKNNNQKGNENDIANFNISWVYINYIYARDTFPNM